MNRSLVWFFLLTVLVCSAKITDNNDKCEIHENETVHMVMDRICEMCHEFSSHSRPNMRAECRSDCFSTEAFRSCLKLFTPKRHTRHVRKHSPHHSA